MKNHPHVETAFVSTNSITQGEQVAVLWNYIFQQCMSIHFAHRTFVWQNAAKGKAAVHCVIIGFGAKTHDRKYIFHYKNNGIYECSLKVAITSNIENCSPSISTFTSPSRKFIEWAKDVINFGFEVFILYFLNLSVPIILYLASKFDNSLVIKSLAKSSCIIIRFPSK